MRAGQTSPRDTGDDPIPMPSSLAEASRKGSIRRLAGRSGIVGLALSLAVIAGLGAAPAAAASSAPYPTAEEKAKIDALIVYYAKRYNVPVALARKVVQTESEYRPLARNGPYWGLMQIRYDTAKGMGYKGPPKGLLDAETNLAFGIAYLSNSLTAAKGNISRGHMLYRTGYYYEAKRRRVLDEMITVDNFRPIGQAPTILAMVESDAETGGLWSGDADSASAGAKPTDAFAAVLAPTPRPKPGEAQPAVAAPTVVQASIASVETAKPKAAAVAAKAEAPAVVAAAAPVAGDLAVAKPQVVYASVLPFSRSTGLTAPASTAPAVLAAAIEPPVMSPVADPTAPIPRPKPGALASADAEAVDASAAEAAVAAADMPVPRPRPAAAIESGIAMSIAPKAAAPAAAAEAAPVIMAQSSVPVPRSRPVETGALQ